MHWLLGCGECSFWYDYWFGSCPLVFYNVVVASLVLVSFYWQASIQDRGKLQAVLVSSIVEQILLVLDSLSLVRNLTYYGGVVSHMSLFISG